MLFQIFSVCLLTSTTWAAPQLQGFVQQVYQVKTTSDPTCFTMYDPVLTQSCSQIAERVCQPSKTEETEVDIEEKCQEVVETTCHAATTVEQTLLVKSEPIPQTIYLTPVSMYTQAVTINQVPIIATVQPTCEEITMKNCKIEAKAKTENCNLVARVKCTPVTQLVPRTTCVSNTGAATSSADQTMTNEAISNDSKNPDEPVLPQQPVVSEAPVAPEVPVTSEAPVAPEIPVTSEAPVKKMRQPFKIGDQSDLILDSPIKKYLSPDSLLVDTLWYHQQIKNTHLIELEEYFKGNHAKEEEHDYGPVDLKKFIFPKSENSTEAPATQN